MNRRHALQQLGALALLASPASKALGSPTQTGKMNMGIFDKEYFSFFGQR